MMKNKKQIIAGISLVSLFSFILALALGASLASAAPGFVYANGTEFYLNGHPFYFTGANNYYLRYADIDCVAYDRNGGCSKEVLDDAQQMNFSVIRTWGFTDGPYYWGSMQPSLKSYDEANFRKLDFIIKEASERGLKVIIPFVNNWKEYGGMCQYVQWCGVPNASMCNPDANSGPSAVAHDSFYTNNCTKQAYKDYIAHMLNRVNNYTGIKYKDDPTIFAWELANEPRAMSDPTGPILTNWIGEMSAFIKTIDQKHMVTAGEEGFYRGKGSGSVYNGAMGNDFISNHNYSTIDFATFHLYPDYWGLGLSQSVTWISEHANDSHSILRKPIILEEFGKQGTQKDSYMQAWYDTTEVYNVNGNLFWELIDQNYPWDPDFGINYPENTSTIGIMLDNVNYWKNINQQKSPSNHAPKLTPIKNITVQEGNTIPININASDADGDYLFYSISDAYHFNRINNQFVWKTKSGDRGNYTITLTASDGVSENKSTFNIIILGNNSCVVPFNGMIVSTNTTFCKGSYSLPNGIQVASNAGLDCNSAEIYGKKELYGLSTNWGITVSGNNISIKNCKIKNYNRGIQLIGASDVQITNNAFNSYLYHGINIRESNNINVSGNTFTKNYDIGTYCYQSKGNFINNNRFVNNGKGIYFDACSETEITGDYFYRNYGGAIHLLSKSDNNTCSKNNILENGIEWRQGGGIVIYGSYNTIKENNISKNYMGISMSNGANNISLNNIQQSAYYDLYNGVSPAQKNNSASNNWFGTKDCSAIQKKIYDCKDNPNYGCLNIEPILSAAYPKGQAIFCSIICSKNLNCGSDGWLGLLCKLGDIWGTYRTYTCQNPGTRASYCEYKDEEKIDRECEYGCEQGACTIKITCSSNEECGTNGLIGSSSCSGSNVSQQYRTWTCNNPATVESYCSYSDAEQITEVCNGNCLDGKCTPPLCTIDSDCGANSWIEIPYCQGNEVWQNYRTYNCTLGTCGYSDSPKSKENCTTCSNGVCTTINSTDDLEVSHFLAQGANLTAGRNISLAFNIKNAGNAPLSNIEWKLDTNVSGTIDGVVSQLSTNENKIIVRQVFYPTPGTYYPKVLVDPNNKITEFNEANNQGEITLTIL
jgi:mannan endo-1,4-beta-mannosidase